MKKTLIALMIGAGTLVAGQAMALKITLWDHTFGKLKDNQCVANTLVTSSQGINPGTITSQDDGYLASVMDCSKVQNISHALETITCPAKTPTGVPVPGCVADFNWSTAPCQNPNKCTAGGHPTKNWHGGVMFTLGDGDKNPGKLSISGGGCPGSQPASSDTQYKVCINKTLDCQQMSLCGNDSRDFKSLVEGPPLTIDIYNSDQ